MHSCTLSAAPIVRLTQSRTISRQVCDFRGCRWERVEQLSAWSGTVIGRTTGGPLAILTVAHGLEREIPVRVALDESTSLTGKVVCLDVAADLGLVTVEHAPRTLCYPLGTEDRGQRAEGQRDRGTEVMFGGYSSRGYRFAATRTKGPAGDGRFWLESTFRQGESGGPILCGTDLVGVIQSTSLCDGCAQGLDVCRRFVSRCVTLQPTHPAPLEPVPSPVGPPAPTAPAGGNLAERLDALDRRIKALEDATVTVRIFGEDGTAKEKTYKRGEPIEFRFVPKK